MRREFNKILGIIDKIPTGSNGGANSISAAARNNYKGQVSGLEKHFELPMHVEANMLAVPGTVLHEWNVRVREYVQVVSAFRGQGCNGSRFKPHVPFMPQLGGEGICVANEHFVAYSDQMIFETILLPRDELEVRGLP